MENFYLYKSIKQAYQNAVDRKWDTLYVMVDIHGTISESNYRDCESPFYPQAIIALQYLSSLPEVFLALYSCGYDSDLDIYKKKLRALGIHFKTANYTPVENTKTGCFDKKPYFNVLIDDKAGFDPKDWDKVAECFKSLRHHFL